MTTVPSDLIDLIDKLIAIEDEKRRQDKLKELLYEELHIPLPMHDKKDNNKPIKIEISLE